MSRETEPDAGQINDALMADWVQDLKAGGSAAKLLGGKLMRTLFPDGYREWLARFHETLKPKLYLEIGVQNGATLMLAGQDTTAFGVDPHPQCSASPGITIFKMKSDDFFRNVEVAGVDMTFVDGMHLFEFALRDIFNAEVISNPGAVILVHDVLAISPETSTREFKEGPWTGDVWKIVPILKNLRPDLKMEIVDCEPSGLLVISDLKPGKLDPAEIIEALNKVIPEWALESAYTRPQDLIVKEPSVLA